MSALAAALVEAQKELPAVPKNATANTGAFSYSYVTLDSLISKTLPVLNKHGLAITQAPEHIEGYGFGLRTTLHHVDGEQVSSVMPLFAGSSMQDMGGAISYARRYAWSALLGIASEHDDDAATMQSNGGGDGQTKDPHGIQQGRGDTIPAVSLDEALADPGSVVLHFSKNAGKRLADLTENQLGWYANEWVPKPECATDQDWTLKAAAQTLAGVPVTAATVESEIPF